MRFGILGPLEIRHGARVVGVAAGKWRALLASLLLGANKVQHVDHLIDVLWDQAPPVTARNLLSIYVHQLRKILRTIEPGRQILLTRPSGYLLEVDRDELDLLVFENMVQSGWLAMAQGDFLVAAELLRQALSLWRGPALMDVPSLRLRQTEVPRLEEARMVALEDRIEADLRLGRHAYLIGELESAVANHPFRERLYQQLTLALYRSGRRAEAVGVYRQAHEVLAEELGVPPGERLRELARAVSRDDADLLRYQDDGARHRAERLPPPAQLPRDVADFTGRRPEVERLLTWLEPGKDDSVAVITGLAGVGKTTLAVHCGYQVLDRFPDGQLFVSLCGDEPGAEVDPADVLAELIRALGAARDAVPEGLPERIRLYRTYTARRRMLILLDGAASEAQVRPLIPGGAGIAVMVTSRGRLAGLEAARVVDLDVPPQREAVELLGKVLGRDRVRAEPAASDTVVRLCGKLPLAVRIAGARLNGSPHRSISELASRLMNENGRLDELTAGDLRVRPGLAASYQRCDESVRRAFRLLARYPLPDIPVQAAAILLGADMASTETLLDRLAEARLLAVVGRDRTGHVRYRFPELLRVFAWECLVAEEETMAGPGPRRSVPDPRPSPSETLR